MYQPLPSRLKFLAIACALIFQNVHTKLALAQEERIPLEQERSQTRTYVADVTADRQRETDDAMFLGTTLRPTLKKIGADTPFALTRPVEPVRSRAMENSQLDGGLSTTTEIPHPSPKRLVRRERIEPDPSKGPVYTPDFSRQKSSFAQLAGKDVIDLPPSDLLPTNSKKVDLSPEGVWALPDLVIEGLAFSPVLQQSRAQLESAEARTGQARADLLPTVSTRIAQGKANTAVEGKNDVSTNSYGTSISRLTQPIYNRTLFQNFSSTKSSEQAATLKVEANQEAVALSIIQATANLASTRVILEFADEFEAQLAEVLRYLEDRAQAGASSKSDLERARTRVLAAKQLRIDQQASYKTAFFELERLVGVTPPAIRLPFLNQLPALPQTQAELRNLVKEYNTDLRALKAEVEAQAAVVSAQYGKLLPSISLSAEHDTQRNTEGPTPRQTDNRLLAVLSWSISLGGKEVYGGREATAELRNRVAKLEEESKRIEQAVETDFNLLQSATHRISTGDSEQKAASNVVSAVREQMKQGRIGSLLDALDAFDRLYSARAKQAQALNQQMLAQAQLLRRLGVLSQMKPPSESMGNAPLSLRNQEDVSSSVSPPT